MVVYVSPPNASLSWLSEQSAYHAHSLFTQEMDTYLQREHLRQCLMHASMLCAAEPANELRSQEPLLPLSQSDFPPGVTSQ
mmetsp:Transcript_61253/g.121229  ORF Transcript_61253/g.121229 Transcript_61253/m.121229 type:complete len:81 (-) Transcript_61253:124-366(-)